MSRPPIIIYGLELNILGLEMHVLYMGKRKPKLYRMKQFDVSPKNKFFFLLRMCHLMFPPLLKTHLFQLRNKLRMHYLGHQK